MDWAKFLTQRAESRAAALHAAAALGSGDTSPAVSLLGAWRFGSDPALSARLLGRLQQQPPRPPDAQRAAVLAPNEALPTPADPSLSARPWLRRRWLDGRVQATCPDDTLHRVAWGLDTLRFLGAEVDRRQRAPWGRLRFPASPHDAAVATMWQGWLSGQPWDLRDPWETLFLGDAARAFAAVLRVRRIPPDRRQLILEDLRETFFYMMLGEPGATAGWQELAVRTLETTGPAPIEALSGLLDTRRWLLASLCAVRRGYGPRSAGILFPETENPDHQARQLARQGLSQASRLDAVLDLHIACRQLDRWATEPETTRPARAWQVVVQNRGRARARLRALLAGEGAALLGAPLLALDGLYARTRYALRRYCRDWAWIQLSRQFPFSVHTLDAPCGALPAGPPLSDDDHRALQSWVLLVILKDRLGHLRRWIQTGGTGDRDAGWGRLLQALPDHLRETGADGKVRRGQNHLRAELAELLPEALERLRPTLAALDALPRDRKLARAAAALIAPDWAPTIPAPKVRWRAYCDSAGAALRTLEEDSP